MSELNGSALSWETVFPQRPGGPIATPTFYWLLFCISIVSFLLDYLVGKQLAIVGAVLHIAGLVPCGFAWLFARSLFRPENSEERWPVLIVAALFACCLALYLDASNSENGLLGYVSQLQTLLGSAVLILTITEALNSKGSEHSERAFRWSFAGVNLALIGTSFVFALPEFAPWQNLAHAVLATCALAGATVALRYRRQHPLAPVDKARSKPSFHPAIAQSLTRLLTDQHVYLNAELKVSHLAEFLGQPEYKVSQCIVNDLAFDNFNQLINTYRIDAVKRKLRQPEFSQAPVLTIALDCGFGSLGPFNRAFKARTGMTPTAYRRAALAKS